MTDAELRVIVARGLEALACRCIDRFVVVLSDGRTAIVRRVTESESEAPRRKRRRHE